MIETRHTPEAPISEGELKRLFAISHEFKLTDEEFAGLARSIGYESRKDIKQKDVPLVETFIKMYPNWDNSAKMRIKRLGQKNI